MENGVQVRLGTAEEHLQLLHALAHELERAMQAISSNSLKELEDSIENQRTLSARLLESSSGKQEACGIAAASQTECGLLDKVRAATSNLKELNKRYATLLVHASRSVEQMASLYASFRGQIQEGAGARLKYQTWSCQV